MQGSLNCECQLSTIPGRRVGRKLFPLRATNRAILPVVWRTPGTDAGMGGEAQAHSLPFWLLLGRPILNWVVDVLKK